jgi:hypothetical protein
VQALSTLGRLVLTELKSDNGVVDLSTGVEASRMATLLAAVVAFSRAFTLLFYGVLSAKIAPCAASWSLLLAVNDELTEIYANGEKTANGGCGST